MRDRGYDVIRHIVFFSAKEADDIAAIADGLRLLGGIPGADLFEVGTNAKLDTLSDAIDLVVYAEFGDETALQAWKSHPLYAEAIRIVRPLRELRHSADIFAPG
jgi:Stress responsive A/B Barrel Domain